MVAVIPERYGVYFANLDPVVGSEMAKTRPVVVISPDAMNRHLDTVVVCPLTSRLHPRWRSRVQTVCDGRQAEVAVDQIRTVSKFRLGPRIDRLPDEAIARLRGVVVEMYAV